MYLHHWYCGWFYAVILEQSFMQTDIFLYVIGVLQLSYDDDEE